MLCGAHMVSGGGKLRWQSHVMPSSYLGSPPTGVGLLGKARAPIADMLGAEMASHVAYVVAVADAAAARNHARLAGGQLPGASQISLLINPSAHVCAVGAAHVAASVDRAAPASAVDPDAAAVTAAASVAVR